MSNELKVGCNVEPPRSVSSCSDEFEEVPLRRHSSNNSTSSSDQVDCSFKKKKSLRKRLKVPWNVLENIATPNDQITFPYYIRNALRHVFNLLDSKAKGNCLIAKTRLQVISATVCLAYNINHPADELKGFNGVKTELSFEELVDYLETAVFTKVDTNKSDLSKFEETTWHIVSNEGRGSDMFSDSNLLTLWRIFNRLTIETNMLDIEEAAIFLQNYMTALGTDWNREHLIDFTKETKLGFWDVIECLETEYLQDIPESVYLEGLETLSQIYIQEIIRTGLLKKKGHQVKSIKSRWFVYTPHLMTYYETSRMAKKKGDIVINSKSKVENIADTKTLKCRFSITCGATGKFFEVEASDQRKKNEWIAAVKQCTVIDDEVTPLMVELSNRADKRADKLKRESCIEMERLEKEAFLRHQQKELEDTRMALGQATMQVETEAALKDEERKRREELEAIKVEYEKLLEEEKLARKEEETARARQQEMYDFENAKRIELERIKAEQDEILAAERKMREGLEEVSKEQAKILDEERERLKLLDEAYKSAAAEVEAAHAKLEASEKESRDAAQKVEKAKERTRQMTGRNGLSQTISPQVRHPTTHRGMGAFTEDDFSKTPIYLTNEERPVPVNRTVISEEEERIQIVETSLVKPSEFSKKIDGES